MLALSALIWLAAGPDWTLRQVRTAVEAGDRAALAPLVDAAALRGSLPGLSLGPGRETGGVGSRTLDALASPAGVIGLLAQGDRAVRMRIVARGLSTFRAEASGGPEPLGLVFRREGASWRLSGIEGAAQDRTALR